MEGGREGCRWMHAARQPAASMHVVTRTVPADGSMGWMVVTHTPTHTPRHTQKHTQTQTPKKAHRTEPSSLRPTGRQASCRSCVRECVLDRVTWPGPAPCPVLLYTRLLLTGWGGQAARRPMHARTTHAHTHTCTSPVGTDGKEHGAPRTRISSLCLCLALSKMPPSPPPISLSLWLLSERNKVT
mmetsp:Transcript_20852/g.50851  ORF Transcript_20852/g.50851 Transcript_20852/m.50851 type:complete len:185 (-) Transcript_20852:2469-3023(-)